MYACVQASTVSSNVPIPDQAGVVICGGGLVGLSCAFELARSGVPHKIIVIEKNKLVINDFLFIRRSP